MEEPNTKNDASRHRMQSELAILEADQRKFERERSELELELKRLRHENDVLILNISEKDIKYKKLKSQLVTISTDIKNLKKKIMFIP